MQCSVLRGTPLNARGARTVPLLGDDINSILMLGLHLVIFRLHSTCITCLGCVYGIDLLLAAAACLIARKTETEDGRRTFRFTPQRVGGQPETGKR